MGYRWIRILGPGLIALGATMVVGWTAPLGVTPTLTAIPCPGGGAARVAAATDPGLPEGAWFRTEPVLDETGVLVGQRLVVAIEALRGEAGVVLPPESFAAGRYGRVVLVGTDDGATSRLETLDLVTGCRSLVGDERDVIRRATISPDGARVYEARVDRATRSDLGIWDRPLDGSAAPRRVLPPIEPDVRFGRTWSTEFAWSVDGDRLAIESCGAAACRTRVYEPVGGRVRLVDEPDLGPMVGLAGDRIVTYGACRGLPCPLISTDVVNDQRDILASEAGDAVLVGRGASAGVVHEVFDGPTRRLRFVDPRAVSDRDLGPIPANRWLASGALRSIGGDPSSGAVRLVTDDESLGAWSSRATIRRIADGTPARIEEHAR